MGNLLVLITTQIPLTSPLDRTLDEWNMFDPDNLKQEWLIYYSNTVWVQYKLGSGKRWVQDGTLNYETILQL